MRELGKRNEAASFLWDFLDFVVTHRTPLYILMQPFIFQKVLVCLSFYTISRDSCFQLAQPPISDFERNIHAKIRDKMRGIGLPFPKSRGALLMELAHQMKELKEELEDASDNTDPKKPEAAQPTVQMTTETNHGRHQRHSLIGLFTGDHGSKGSAEHPHTTLPTKGIFWFE
jgi:hypothetical protein